MIKNNMKRFELSTLSKACIVAFGMTALPSIAAQVTPEEEKKKKVEETEVIEVLGVRSSIRQSINDKRFADEIMDSISA